MTRIETTYMHNPHLLETLHTLASMDFGLYNEAYLWRGPGCLLVYFESTDAALPAVLLNKTTHTRQELPAALPPHALRQALTKAGWQPGYGYRSKIHTL